MQMTSSSIYSANDTSEIHIAGHNSSEAGCITTVRRIKTTPRFPGQTTDK